jgi:hypothetical protein
MPNAPKTPVSRFRIDADEWAAFGEAVPEDTDRSAVLRQFVAWYLHRPGVKAVKRQAPPATPVENPRRVAGRAEHELERQAAHAEPGPAFPWYVAHLQPEQVAQLAASAQRHEGWAERLQAAADAAPDDPDRAVVEYATAQGLLGRTDYQQVGAEPPES